MTLWAPLWILWLKKRFSGIQQTTQWVLPLALTWEMSEHHYCCSKKESYTHPPTFTLSPLQATQVLRSVQSTSWWDGRSDIWLAPPSEVFAAGWGHSHTWPSQRALPVCRADAWSGRDSGLSEWTWEEDRWEKDEEDELEISCSMFVTFTYYVWQIWV